MAALGGARVSAAGADGAGGLRPGALRDAEQGPGGGAVHPSDASGGIPRDRRLPDAALERHALFLGLSYVYGRGSKGVKAQGFASFQVAVEHVHEFEITP